MIVKKRAVSAAKLGKPGLGIWAMGIFADVTTYWAEPGATQLQEKS